MTTIANYLCPDWPAPPAVRACMSLRYDKNAGEFDLLKPAAQHILRDDLHLPHAPLWLKQVHGMQAVIIDNTQKDSEENSQEITADAQISFMPHHVCAVRTADCLPVLLCDQNATVIAAIHAGWRGLAAGVIENTVLQIKKQVDIHHHNPLLAWLGPAIGAESFEVGKDVCEIFLRADSAATEAFTAISDHKFLADIYLLARQRLKKMGVTKMYGSEYCTYRDASRFHSFRRDGEKSGRMASLIWIAG